jgi:hypothetical protein
MKRLCRVLNQTTEFRAGFQQQCQSESIYMRRSQGKKQVRYLMILMYSVVIVGANHQGDHQNTHQDTTHSRVKQTLLLLSGF